MTWSFNPNIPAAPNDPADDQPRMLQNNSSISSLISVDHVGFNTAGGGEHLRVTFKSSNPPAVPTNPPVLFTNTQDGAAVPNILPGGIAGLFYYSGTDVQGQLQNVVANPGSILLFGNIIMKWFTVTVNGAGGTFLYSGSGLTPFPNNAFNAQLSAGSTGFSLAVSSLNATQIIIGKSPTPNPVSVNVLIIGN